MDPRYSKQIEQLYMEMFDMLLCYAQCSFQETALAEEAVQETFRIACQKPKQLCLSPNPRGWLVNTLKYTICNMKRSRESALRLLSAYLFRQRECVAFAEDRMSLQLMYGNVFDSEEFQLLREMTIDGRSQLEMAASRGITVDACRKRVQRAKKILQKKVQEDVTN